GRDGERVARGPRTGSAGGAPVPARDATGAGEGHAEEWLGAVPSSLTPEPPSPPPVQRIRLRYRKLGPARFIGTRAPGSVLLRAAPSIDAGIAAFVYEVDLAALDRPPAPDAVAAALERFARASSFPLRKHTRAGERTVDARRFVRALAMSAPLRLSLELAVGPEGTVKPGAFLGELLAIPPEE